MACINRQSYLSDISSARKQLERITDLQASRPLEAGHWAPKQILGHLIDSAANNHQRFVRAQEVEFLDFPSYSQIHWVEAAGYKNIEWLVLVSLWANYNMLLANIIGHIPEQKLSVICTASWNKPPRDRLSLAELIEGYFEHLNHHLDQLLPLGRA